MAGSLHTNGTHAPHRSHIMQNSMHHHHHMLPNGGSSIGQQESTNYMMTTSSAAVHPHHQISQQQQQLKAHCSQQQQQQHWGNEIVHHGMPDDSSRGYYKSEDASTRLQQQQQQEANGQYKYNGNLVREVSFNVGIEVESCVNAGSFTNVHYSARPPISMDAINPTSAVGDHGFAPHEELRAREDSLDLYSTFRDDSYSENSDDFSNESGDTTNRFQPSIGAPMHTVNQIGMNFPGNHLQQQPMHNNVYPESDYFNVSHHTNDYHGHNTTTNQMGHHQQSYQHHSQPYGRQHDPQQFTMANLPPPDMYSSKPIDFLNGYHNHAHPNVGVPSSCIYTSATPPQQHPMCTPQPQSMCQQMPSTQQQHINPIGFHQHPSGSNNLIDGSTSNHLLPGVGYTGINEMGHYGKLEPFGDVPHPTGEALNGEGGKPPCKVFQQIPQINRLEEGSNSKGPAEGEGEKSSSDEDGLSENFGEIIKKSMVETVSA